MPNQIHQMNAAKIDVLKGILTRVPADLLRAELDRRQRALPLREQAGPVLQAVAAAWSVQPGDIILLRVQTRSVVAARWATNTLLRTHAEFDLVTLCQLFNTTPGSIHSWQFRHRNALEENTDYKSRLAHAQQLLNS